MDVNSTLRWAVVGNGRLGGALAAAMPSLDGPFPRGFDGADHDVVVLAVPDAEIANAAAAITPDRLVGHCSGATTLEVLQPHEAFSVHPLMTVTRNGASFEGASAAIAGSTDRARDAARWLATQLGLRPVTIAEEQRAAYHAAASIAANFLVTLEDAAETLIRAAGGDREMLIPLARAALDNWAAVGGPDALTGPIARGDVATVARQRAAVATNAKQLLDLFDALADATAALAARR